MLKRPTLVILISLSICLAAGCSKSAKEDSEDAPAAQAARGDDSALPNVRRGARALTRERASIDFVAAELEGVIMARTRNQALMHYDGYRIILTTPGDIVTRITFQLDEARPTIAQLDELFGKPEVVPKGMLYEHTSLASGSTIHILAQPVTKPAEDGTLVREILIEGAPTR